MATDARLTRRAAAASVARGEKAGGSAGQSRLLIVVIHLLLLAGVFLMIAPFIWMLLGSLKPFAEFLQIPPTWLPAHPTTENYSNLLDKLDFPRYFGNSLIV